VCHLIDTKWKFLGKTKTCKLTPAEMFPKDLYFDNNNEERISINILCHCEFGFVEMVDLYAKQQGLEIAKKKYKAGTSEDDANSNSNSKTGVSSKGGTSPGDKKKKSGKVGWMFSKMVGFLDMFKEKKEESSSSSDSEDGDHERGYRTFEDEVTPPKEQALGPQGGSFNFSEKAQIGEVSQKTNEFNEKYEQTLMEIQSQMAHGCDSNIGSLTLPNLLHTGSKTVKSTAALEKVKDLEIRDALSEGEVGNPPGQLGTSPKVRDSEKKTIPSPGNKMASPSSSQRNLKTDPKELFKKIIVHIHGGGFMAMGSTYHETYLRLFAIETERPLFSIDYRLAPQVQFPDPLHDCIRGWFWIKQFVEEVVGTNIESVVLVGDSAGGNLAFALTYWLIENGQKTPDLLIGCYSALRLETKFYTPSFLKSFDDYFLSYAGLWACCRQYLPEGVEQLNDKYISPILADESLLAKMPRTHMLVCMDDPLMDDQFRMAYKMHKAGAKIRVSAFRYFIHGMLSLNRAECLPVRVFQDEVISSMKSVFNANSDGMIPGKMRQKEDSSKKSVSENSEGEFKVNVLPVKPDDEGSPEYIQKKQVNEPINKTQMVIPSTPKLQLKDLASKEKEPQNEFTAIENDKIETQTP